MKKKLILVVFLFIGFCLQSQTTFPENGPKDSRQNIHAFVGATVVISPTKTLEQATLVIKNGKIVSVSQETAPTGAIIHEVKGTTIYPSFIELHSDYGIQMNNQSSQSNYPQPLSNKKGAYGWNEAIKSEVSAAEYFSNQNTKAKQLRANGFGAAVVHNHDGIARGTGALVTLADTKEQYSMIAPQISNHFSFSKGSSSQDYPSSLMGGIALLRQTNYDAKWYQENNAKTETNLSLEAFNKNLSLPAFFETTEALDILRANQIAKEFKQTYIYIGNGDEYQHIQNIQQTNSTVVIPLNFPKAYNVSNPLDAQLVSYKQLKHWELAPHNPYFLDQANISFAITSSKLDQSTQFLTQLKQAVQSGLQEKKALAALTTVPANLIHKESIVGTLEPGKLANFIIVDGNIFTGGSILENWIQGIRYQVKKETNTELDGLYTLRTQTNTYTLEINQGKYIVTTLDSIKLKTTGSFSNGSISISYETKEGQIRLYGWTKGTSLTGNGIDETGKAIQWNARYTSEIEQAPNKQTTSELVIPSLSDIRKPFTGYGWKNLPKQVDVLFTNATVWTGETDGILKHTDVLISKGKIKSIGKNLSARNAIKIDATNKHLTAGIIDEHSHIAISRGVNEGTQASSAEVRIGDVINSDHIALYRVLAGGVTTSQLLHGSANPIGGQSAIIKSRWGLSPEHLKLKHAPGFIKFALGENVKQSNWGDRYRSRYPQTRMGVEQVYEDYFTKAIEYSQNKSKQFSRVDLELEAILEIINKQRFITCHSYVQSEINMLMNVAENYNFKVNTFTHILEGYKVADKMLAHGVGASTFADWWAYKYEVIDAIPYNAAILAREGVITAINSDDAEMARRLNQEAAKIVRYGNISEEQAWNMITINPAKLLHIDDRVGSIKTGKDADLVLWSHHPLSIYAIAEQTYIDGIKYYDAKEAKANSKEVKAEKEALIQQMLSAKQQGKETQPIEKENTYYYSCKHLGQQGHTNTNHSHE